VTASLVRGMTLAPRVQVYTQLSCQANYRNLDSHLPASVVISSNSFESQSQSQSRYTTNSRSLSLSSDSTASSISATSASPILNLSFINTVNTNDSASSSEAPHRDPCASDPDVQAGAATLQTTYMLLMGIASVLSTSWWGHFGERHGRMRVLAFSTIGTLLRLVMFLWCKI
jgi:hypothetical protein